MKAWLDNGWLDRHTPSATEVGNLLAVVDRDLAQAAAPDLAPEWKLNIAYSAARTVADLALRAEGYRAGRERSHEQPIEALRFTLGVPSGIIKDLKRFKKKRNIDTYERVGVVSEGEAEAMLKLATRLRAEAIAWLAKAHPDLLKQ